MIWIIKVLIMTKTKVWINLKQVKKQKDQNKDQQIHVENLEKIKSKDQENYLYHVRRMDEQQKNYNINRQ